METTSGASGVKRKAEDILVDPDTQQLIEDAKKPRIDLDAERKFNCLKSLVQMHSKLLVMAFQPAGEKDAMDIVDAGAGLVEEARKNINVGNHISSIMFTIHNVCRQEVKKASTNMIKKTAGTMFKINFKGKEYSLDNTRVKGEWTKTLKENGLEYKDFPINDKENWFSTIIAEILLVTTARQATRMFFPITIFAAVWNKQKEPRKYCDFFSTTGAGGWYTYKAASNMSGHFTMSGEMEEEKAAQIVYHSIFGTYKEDLSILPQITGVSTWFTREEMGICFRLQGTSASVTKVVLPKMQYYSKMSCANQTGPLSGVYNQVATVPCFSGARLHRFDAQFFEHIEKKRIVGTSGKTIAQIVNILTSTLEELHSNLRKDNGKIKMGTTKWREMSSLKVGNHGNETDIQIEGQGKMFLGKK